MKPTDFAIDWCQNCHRVWFFPRQGNLSTHGSARVYPKKCQTSPVSQIALFRLHYNGSKVNRLNEYKI